MCVIRPLFLSVGLTTALTAMADLRIRPMVLLPLLHLPHLLPCMAIRIQGVATDPGTPTVAGSMAMDLLLLNTPPEEEGTTGDTSSCSLVGFFSFC